MVGRVGMLADYICDGTADDVELNAASAALQSGQKMFIRNGTYSCNARVNLTSKSNVVIEGESQGGVVLQAAQSLFVSGNDHHLGVLNVRSHTTPIRGITIKNLTIDANNQLKTQCMTITGGSTESTAGTSKVRVKNVTFKNMGFDTGATETARSCVELISGNMFFGDFGRIDDIKFDGCEFDTSTFYHVYVLGNFVTNFKITKTLFTNNDLSTINFHQYSFQTGKTSQYRSHQNWEISHCRFVDTKLRDTGSTHADVNDANRTGIRSLEFHHNYLSPATDLEADWYVINTHGTWGLSVHHNYFDQINQAVSIGQSLAGAYYKIDPDQYIDISHNVFFKMVKGTGLFDHDSGLFEKFSHNFFIECDSLVFGGYSRHWPTTYEHNIIYNCNSNVTGGSDFHDAAIEIVGDGYIVRNNTFIDDRLLSDPTTAPTLSQASGGALGARTYYVKYTWANDTGETLASSQATISASANNLVTATLPSSNTYPTGAKKINIYASTVSGSETLQDFIEVGQFSINGSPDWSTMDWTEPTTGLVAGAGLPVSNTTAHLTLYGIYELTGAGGLKLPNHYYGNHFYGIETEIFTSSSYKRVRHDNYTNSSITASGESLLEALPYNQGNITGAVTLDPANTGEYITTTSTGNVTLTISNGHYIGQRMRWENTQDATGGRTISKPSNVKLPGGAWAPTATGGAKDQWTLEWDGTNWVEVARTPNIS